MRGAARGSWRGVVESGAGFFALYFALQIRLTTRQCRDSRVGDGVWTVVWCCECERVRLTLQCNKTKPSPLTRMHERRDGVPIYQ